MNRYRLIYYVPDPIQGARFLIGAALADGESVRVLETERVPGPACLGSVRRSATLSLIRDSFAHFSSFDELPHEAGPHALLGDARNVPQGVTDVSGWVRAHVLTMDSVPEMRTRTTHPHRGTFGMQFFERWQVARHVRRRFNPKSDWGGWLAEVGDTLKPVTHWVPGKNQVLLLEPVVPQHESFERELQDIGGQFWAYRSAIKHVGVKSSRRARLIAYVVRGGTKRAREEALASLQKPADDVIDGTSEDRARQLADIIRETALTSDDQPRLDM